MYKTEGWEGAKWQESAQLTGVLCSPAPGSPSPGAVAFWSNRLEKMAWCFESVRSHWSKESDNSVVIFPLLWSYPIVSASLQLEWNLRHMLAHTGARRNDSPALVDLPEGLYNYALFWEGGRKEIPLDSVYSSDSYAHFFTYRWGASSRFFPYCEHLLRPEPFQNNPSPKLHFNTPNTCLPE